MNKDVHIIKEWQAREYTQLDAASGSDQQYVLTCDI